MYELNQLVRLADIPDPPFPSLIGATGKIEKAHSPVDPGDPPVYEVRIGQQLYACFPADLELWNDDPTDYISPDACRANNI